MAMYHLTTADAPQRLSVYQKRSRGGESPEAQLNPASGISSIKTHP